MPAIPPMQHPVFTRRTALQAGAAGLLGLGMNHVHALRALGAENGTTPRASRAKTCIYIFLSGGLSQLDTFDLKPEATDGIRGDFKPSATNTTGIQICEHLPRLAQRSHLWSLVRSLTHPSNSHSEGHLFMLTGRSQLPPGFSPADSRPGDWPCIAAVAGEATLRRTNLPPAAVLPEKLQGMPGGLYPGQRSGQMGRQREPWFIEVSPVEPWAYGAYPDYEFDHQRRPYTPRRKSFVTPNLSLPEGVGSGRFGSRLDVLKHIDEQRRDLERVAVSFDKYQHSAITLLTDPRVRQAFDLTGTDPRVLDRYGNNSFGWSLLMARRLVESGVNLVQVNLGNSETWDTHGFIFTSLRDKLLPPLDRCLSALLDNLHENGLLDDTLIVMAGEFGRTPKISTLPQFYKEPGRDHWGAVQTVFFAGGGTRGGRVVGKSDRTGGYPADDPQTPESMAATIYHSLGIPQTAMWKDATDRPRHIYHGEPIQGLF